jgi:Fe-S cluster biosynthesis and repair protein YggX
MPDISCVRCNETRAQLPAPPLRGELGDRIFDSICQTCWSEWLREQTAIINHYALDVREQQAREFLTKQTGTFLFGLPQA